MTGRGVTVSPQTEQELTHSHVLDRDSVVDECIGKISLPNALSTKENVVTYLAGSADTPNQMRGKQQYQHILKMRWRTQLLFFKEKEQGCPHPRNPHSDGND